MSGLPPFAYPFCGTLTASWPGWRSLKERGVFAFALLALTGEPYMTPNMHETLTWGYFAHGEVRVYRGTGVSRGVQRTTWERSLKIGKLQIPCFEGFFWGGNTLGLIPASLPHTLGCACTFYAPTSPPPINIFISGPFFHPQPPSLLFLLLEPGSERKVLTKETWFPLLRE